MATMMVPQNSPGAEQRNPPRRAARPMLAPPAARAPAAILPASAPPARDPAADPAVPGPFGRPLRLADLPPPGTRRWVVRRKAEVVAAINGGLLSEAEACARYGLSPEELEFWQQAIDRAGVPGLRVTRIQLYRDHDCRRLRSGSDGRPTAVWRS